jgi:hypothetical protein
MGVRVAVGGRVAVWVGVTVGVEVGVSVGFAGIRMIRVPEALPVCP